MACYILWGCHRFICIWTWYLLSEQARVAEREPSNTLVEDLFDLSGISQGLNQLEGALPTISECRLLSKIDLTLFLSESTWSIPWLATNGSYILVYSKVRLIVCPLMFETNHNPILTSSGSLLSYNMMGLPYMPMRFSHSSAFYFRTLYVGSKRPLSST